MILDILISIFAKLQPVCCFVEKRLKMSLTIIERQQY